MRPFLPADRYGLIHRSLSSLCSVSIMPFIVLFDNMLIKSCSIRTPPSILMECRPFSNIHKRITGLFHPSCVLFVGDRAPSLDPSPYPRSRKTSESSMHSRKSSDCGHLEQSLMQQLAVPLQEMPVNYNVPTVPQSPAPALNLLHPFTPFAVKFNGDRSLVISEKDLPIRAARPRVASNARRTALGCRSVVRERALPKTRRIRASAR